MDGNLAYREKPRYEIINGKVVMMASSSPNHNRIAGSIHNMFYNYLKNSACEVFQDNTDLFLGEDNREFKPDMMVVCDPEKIRGDKGIFGAPDLIVEVLSPRTARYDRGAKKDVYERYVVREYWIVDPRIRSVEQYVLEGGKYRLRDIYTQFSEKALEDMDEEDRAELVTEFHCGLFDDLIIRLDDVFARLPKEP